MFKLASFMLAGNAVDMSIRDALKHAYEES